ncbi:Uncharacterized protein B5E38_4996 [Bacillus cereus]|nr:Uncharacterized protein B5E38_4996 [Bacillus cereus]ARO65082.1 Uncharacterized protein B5E39_2711 [Bacillus cereus]
MDQLITVAIENLMQKDTVFLCLFLVGYYLQYVDKKEQKDFINKQQKVLTRLTSSVEKLVEKEERQDERLERIEGQIFKQNN